LKKTKEILWSNKVLSFVKREDLKAEMKVKRTEKQELISTMNDVFKTSELVVVTLNKGMTVAETTELRNKVREKGAGYRVTKNRLTRLALAGTPCEALLDMMSGPTGIAYANDPAGTAKALMDFAKDNEKFEVLGAVMDGKKLTIDELKMLASLPSLDELRAKILGVITAPATKIACVVQAPAGQIARVVNAYSSKQDA
jgi:large subunit ribosomal protein L10